LPQRARILVGACLLGSVALGLTGCGLSRGRSAESQSNRDLHLVSFGALGGEPWGHFDGAGLNGSIAQRASYIDSLETNRVPFLHLDLGNFSSFTHRETQNEKITEFIWDSMVDMKVDASTPGPFELENWSQLQGFIDAGAIPIISSNLFLRKDNAEERLGLEYLVLERNGIQVALFALFGEEPFAETKLPDDVDLRLGSPVDTARRMIPELKRLADVVVLLSQMTVVETADLLSRTDGIDIALCGFNPGYAENGLTFGTTIVQRTGHQGRYIGDLTLIVDPEGEVVEWGVKNPRIGDWLRPNQAMEERSNRLLRLLREERAQARLKRRKRPQD